MKKREDLRPLGGNHLPKEPEWTEDELSEKYLTSNYRNIKMTDVPPMWEEIERNLAPKKPRRAIPLRRLASLAAVVLAVLILVPVLYVLRQGQGKKMSQSDNSFNSAAQMEDVDKLESHENEEELCIEVSKDSDAASDEAKDTDIALNETQKEGDNHAPTDAAKDQGDQSSGASAIPENGTEADTDTEESASQEAAGSILQLQIQIQEAWTEEGRILITAKVLEAPDNDWPKGETVTLTCDQGKYQMTDFEGIMSLKVTKENEENIFKILEILP